MLLIFVVILVLFGGDKLPDFVRGMGKTLREFKKAASGVEDEFRRALEEDERRKNPPPPIPPPTSPNTSPDSYAEPGYETYDPYAPSGSADDTPGGETKPADAQTGEATPAGPPAEDLPYETGETGEMSAAEPTPPEGTDTVVPEKKIEVEPIAPSSEPPAAPEAVPAPPEPPPPGRSTPPGTA